LRDAAKPPPSITFRPTRQSDTIVSAECTSAQLGHPIVGQTWESFVAETLITSVPDRTEASYFRTSNGTEVDLVLTLPGEELWAIKVKRTMSPKIERGFHSACADLNPQKRFYVYPGTERFPLDNKTDAIGVVELAK
jgi:uncharacterized protein